MKNAGNVTGLVSILVSAAIIGFIFIKMYGTQKGTTAGEPSMSNPIKAINDAKDAAKKLNENQAHNSLDLK